jgi:hypothetical protein
MVDGLSNHFMGLMPIDPLPRPEKPNGREVQPNASQSEIIRAKIEPLEAKIQTESVECKSIFSPNFTEILPFTKTNAEISPKEPNFELKLLPTSFDYELFGLNKTYLVFVIVNLDPAQTEYVLIFSLKFGTSNHVSCEPLKNFS